MTKRGTTSLVDGRQSKLGQEFVWCHVSATCPAQIHLSTQCVAAGLVGHDAYHALIKTSRTIVINLCTFSVLSISYHWPVVTESLREPLQ